MWDQRRGEEDGEHRQEAGGGGTGAPLRVALDGGLVISMPLGGQRSTTETQVEAQQVGYTSSTCGKMFD